MNHETEHQVLFAVTHVNESGMRTLTRPNQGRNHFSTRAEAEHWMKEVLQNTPLKTIILVWGPLAPSSFAVRSVNCYCGSGDAIGIYFQDTLRELWSATPLGAAIHNENYLRFLNVLEKKSASSLKEFCNRYVDLWDMTPDEASRMVEEWARKQQVLNPAYLEEIKETQRKEFLQ